MTNFLLYLTTVLIWGSTWLVIKFQLTQVDPVLSVAYRFGIAAVILFVVCLAGRMYLRFSFRDHLFMALQGATLFGGSYILVYLATEHLTSGLVAVVFSTILLMNILNLRLFLGQPVQKQAFGAGSLGLAGICLVFWPELLLFGNSASLTGLLLVFMATYIASTGNIIAARNSRAGIPVTPANAFGMAYGAAFTLVLGVFRAGELQFSLAADYLMPLLYLSILGSVVAFGSYIKLIARIGADRAAYALILSPILALVLSTFVEDYHWTLPAAAGIVLVLLGNILVLRPGETKASDRND